MRIIISCSNVIGEKSQKYAGKGCYPPPSPVKKMLLVMLVDTSANDKIKFSVKILLFILQVFLFKCKYH